MIAGVVILRGSVFVSLESSPLTSASAIIRSCLHFSSNRAKKRESVGALAAFEMRRALTKLLSMLSCSTSLKSGMPAASDAST